MVLAVASAWNSAGVRPLQHSRNIGGQNGSWRITVVVGCSHSHSLAHVGARLAALGRADSYHARGGIRRYDGQAGDGLAAVTLPHIVDTRGLARHSERGSIVRQ
jgi:hypothetical protein